MMHLKRIVTFVVMHRARDLPAEPPPAQTQAAQREDVLCHEQKLVYQGDDLRAFVYWREDSRVLGVLTFKGPMVFEKTLERRQRRVLLKDVTDSLLDNKWR